ncbi:hypothetical protein HMPREF9373_2006 [Psychrobacter sp. 1501(2011)]|nr:hypothetical protein HMPREF9373_2006 [Psychrobacter sp. 1501(2011)]
MCAKSSKTLIKVASLYSRHIRHPLRIKLWPNHCHYKASLPSHNDEKVAKK